MNKLYTQSDSVVVPGVMQKTQAFYQNYGANIRKDTVNSQHAWITDSLSPSFFRVSKVTHFVKKDGGRDASIWELLTSTTAISTQQESLYNICWEE